MGSVSFLRYPREGSDESVTISRPAEGKSAHIGWVRMAGGVDLSELTFAMVRPKDPSAPDTIAEYLNGAVTGVGVRADVVGVRDAVWEDGVQTIRLWLTVTSAASLTDIRVPFSVFAYANDSSEHGIVFASVVITDSMTLHAYRPAIGEFDEDDFAILYPNHDNLVYAGDATQLKLASIELTSGSGAATNYDIVIEEIDGSSIPDAAFAVVPEADPLFIDILQYVSGDLGTAFFAGLGSSLTGPHVKSYNVSVSNQVIGDIAPFHIAFLSNPVFVVTPDASTYHSTNDVDPYVVTLGTFELDRTADETAEFASLPGGLTIVAPVSGTTYTLTQNITSFGSYTVDITGILYVENGRSFTPFSGFTDGFSGIVAQPLDLNDVDYPGDDRVYVYPTVDAVTVDRGVMVIMGIAFTGGDPGSISMTVTSTDGNAPEVTAHLAEGGAFFDLYTPGPVGGEYDAAHYGNFTYTITLTDGGGDEQTTTLVVRVLSTPTFVLQPHNQLIIRDIGDAVVVATFVDDRTEQAFVDIEDDNLPANVTIENDESTTRLLVFTVQSAPSQTSIDMSAYEYIEHGRTFTPFAEAESFSVTITSQVSAPTLEFEGEATTHDPTESITTLNIHESAIASFYMTFSFTGGLPGDVITATLVRDDTYSPDASSYAVRDQSVSLVPPAIPNTAEVGAVDDGTFIATFSSSVGTEITLSLSDAIPVPAAGTTNYVTSKYVLRLTGGSLGEDSVNSEAFVVNVFTDLLAPARVLYLAANEPDPGVSGDVTTTINFPASAILNSVILQRDQYVAGGIAFAVTDLTISTSIAATNFVVDDTTKNIIVSSQQSDIPDSETIAVAIGDLGSQQIGETFTLDRYLVDGTISTGYTDDSVVLIPQTLAIDSDIERAEDKGKGRAFLERTEVVEGDTYQVFRLTGITFSVGTFSASIAVGGVANANFFVDLDAVEDGSGDVLVYVAEGSALFSQASAITLTLHTDGEQDVGGEWLVDLNSHTLTLGTTGATQAIVDTTMTLRQGGVSFSLSSVVNDKTLVNFLNAEASDTDVYQDAYVGPSSIFTDRLATSVFWYDEGNSLFDADRIKLSTGVLLVGIFALADEAGVKSSLADFYALRTSDVVFLDNAGSSLGSLLAIRPNGTMYSTIGSTLSGVVAIAAASNAVTNSNAYVLLVQHVEGTPPITDSLLQDLSLMSVNVSSSYLTQTTACHDGTGDFVSQASGRSADASIFRFALQTVVNTVVTEANVLVRRSIEEDYQFPDSFLLSLSDTEQLSVMTQLTYSLQARAVGSSDPWIVMKENLVGNLTRDQLVSDVQETSLPERVPGSMYFFEGLNIVGTQSWAPEDALEYRLMVQNAAATGAAMVSLGTYAVTNHRSASCNAQFRDLIVPSDTLAADSEQYSIPNYKITRRCISDYPNDRSDKRLYSEVFSVVGQLDDAATGSSSGYLGTHPFIVMIYD